MVTDKFMISFSADPGSNDRGFLSHFLRGSNMKLNGKTISREQVLSLLTALGFPSPAKFLAAIAEKGSSRYDLYIPDKDGKMIRSLLEL